MSRWRFSSEKALALARSFSATIVPHDFFSAGGFLMFMQCASDAGRISPWLMGVNRVFAKGAAKRNQLLPTENYADV